MGTKIYDLIVLGAGPAGLTAGLYAHRAGLDVLLLGGHSPGGQVTLHYKVENYPGFPGGITGAQLMMLWLQQVVDELGCSPDYQPVIRTEFSNSTKHVHLRTESFQAESVVIATGSRPRRLSVPGESEFEGRGVFYCATCDAPLLRTMERSRVAVVGGGDTAFHTAMALMPHAESVTIITRASEPRAKVSLTQKIAEYSKARVLVNRSVKSVEGKDRVTHLVLENPANHAEELFELDGVFVGIGQSPVTDFLDSSIEKDEQGFVVTNPLLETSVAGVYAAGDVRTTPLRQILTAAADGALAAYNAADYLRMKAKS